MAFRLGIRKNKEDDEIEDLENAEEEGKIDLKKKKIKDKDFKDLKSEHRKDRKEVIKPWGRKERVIVLLIFLFLTLTPAILGLSSRKWKLPGFPRFAVPDIKLPKVGENKIMLEENSKDTAKTTTAKESFLSLTSELTGVYALSVLRLNNGSSYGVNEDTKLTAASLIKLPVIAALYVEAENNNINLDEKYILKNEDKVGGSGSLSRKAAGYEVTYRNLAVLMGKQSDNTAYRIIRNTVGDEKINEIIKKSGMVSTNLIENITSASDISRFFESLWRGNLVSISHREEILDLLTDTIYESWLSAGLPENVVIAHKYGREVHVVNDAGIVINENPYVIVVLSDGIVDKQADEVFPKISTEIFNIESN